jgi:hypothetical protein
MKKLKRLIAYMFLIGVLSLLVADYVFAEQTVKTIDIPLGFEALLAPEVIQFYNFTIFTPDGIEDVISLELEVVADLLAGTKAYGGVFLDNVSIFCNPTELTAPPWNVDNYKMIFDCTSEIPDNFNWGAIADTPMTFVVQFDNFGGNVKPRLRMTYYNYPDADIEIGGTYYEVGDQGKVFAQLSESGIPLNNATCYISIYYPDNTVMFRNLYICIRIIIICHSQSRFHTTSKIIKLNCKW